uniref:Protein kinase domain-containing protein n=1 Tax=Oryza punctata TaxID=4537 RepID=A0A0E0LGT1_ORYPU
MPEFSRLLCFLLLIDVALGGVDDGFVYNGFSSSSSNLLLDGAAYIGEDGILTLTNSSEYNAQGLCFHPQPHHTGQVHNFSRAFNSNNPFLTVELDSVYRMDDQNNVRVDLDSLAPIAFAPAGYRVYPYSFQPLSLTIGNLMQAWIDMYYGNESFRVEVTLAPFPMNRPFQQLLSCELNSSTAAAIVGDDGYVYVGFSSSTSNNKIAAHQVHGWSFMVDGPAKPLDYQSMMAHKHRPPRANHRSLLRWLPATLSFLLLLIAAASVIWYTKWSKNSTEEEGHQECEWEDGLGPRRFAHKDLRRATDGFSIRRLLGKGGFGRVYMGVLANEIIAVKMISSADSDQGMAQFTAEVITLGRLRHRNLVRLLGYCRHKGQLLLVYDYMPNGSLDKFLHDDHHEPCKRTLNWPRRLHVIKCVAAGLLYLHDDWEQVIVHRDVKASNGLLDADMNGRLGDFGLARLHDHGADAHTTHVAGTRGYLAPELTRFGKANKATDVFAFGAFVLEVARGRRPMGHNARGELLVLVEWVRGAWAAGGSVVDTMDPRLEEYSTDEAELVLKLGLLCSHPLPAARPGMRLVMQYLDGDLQLPEFSPDYLCIKDVDQVQGDEYSPSVATMITGLSGGR